MEFSVTRLEKDYPLIQVTAWAGLTVGKKKSMNLKIILNMYISPCPSSRI